MTSFSHPMFERFSKFSNKDAASLEGLAMPGRKSEEFRFFDVKRITEHDWQPAGENTVDPAPFLLPEAAGSTLVVRDGRLDLDASSLQLPDGVFVGRLDDLPTAEQGAARDALRSAAAPYADDVFTRLNDAMFTDVACVFLQKDVSLPAPIHVLYLASGEDTFNAPRLLLVAAAGSKATLVEDFRSDDCVFTNAVSEVVLAENANVHHVRVQREGEQARHVSRVGARVGRFARYDSVHVSLGANSSRTDLWVSHEGEDGWSRIDGLAMVDGTAETDTHSVIDNTKVRCQSHQLHKCIVDDRAHAVFNGKIMVRKGAQNIDAYQLNRNLLLSARAKVDTKPQLEIFADDVQCSHGATVGQLDDEHLFYLQSRGLSAEQARTTLTYAFAAEVIESIGVPSLVAVLEDTAHQRTMRRR